jgi:uncharacterized protein YeaO (DUF488 family)
MGRPRKPKAKRVYDDPSPDDGVRVLVDRVWPRGLTKQRARLDDWCKAVAPSTQLRSWYSHDPARYDEFVRRYEVELKDPERAEAFNELKSIARRSSLTLVTATKEIELSQAAVLARLLSP